MTTAASEQTAFLIKGHPEGLLITLQDVEWNVFTDDFLKQIHEREFFFRGARVAIDIGNRSPSISDISSLRDRLSDYNITLWALKTTDEHTKESIRNLGLETRIPSTKQESKIKPFDTLISGEDAVFLRRTLRSGFRVVHRGHVVVMGDVNPGAEIIAGGSVIVWGRLRGVVHAGAEGDENAVVCALDLEPTQIRIASIVSVPPNRKGKPQPEIVFIQDGKLVAKPLK